MNERMVEVPAEEFLRTHRGLVKLLQTIEKHQRSGDQLPTNKLCIAAFSTRSKYCATQLELAEKLGYIDRKAVRRLNKADGTPNKTPYIVNLLTPKGIDVLEEIKRELGEEL